MVVEEVSMDKIAMAAKIRMNGKNVMVGKIGTFLKVVRVVMVAFVGMFGVDETVVKIVQVLTVPADESKTVESSGRAGLYHDSRL